MDLIVCEIVQELGQKTVHTECHSLMVDNEWLFPPHIYLLTEVIEKAKSITLSSFGILINAWHRTVASVK